MNWFLWTYLTISILDIVAKIMSIGEEREPRTPALVAFDTLFNGTLTFGVLYFGMKA